MRRTPLKRGKPLSRSTPLPRETPLKRVNKKRRGHRFPKNVCEPLREFVRGLPCLLRGQTSPGCEGPTEPDHYRTRGAGGADRYNLNPLCAHHHWMRHHMGIRSFQSHYGLDLGGSAQLITEDFDRRYPGSPASPKEET